MTYTLSLSVLSFMSAASSLVSRLRGTQVMDQKYFDFPPPPPPPRPRMYHKKSSYIRYKKLVRLLIYVVIYVIYVVYVSLSCPSYLKTHPPCSLVRGTANINSLLIIASYLFTPNIFFYLLLFLFFFLSLPLSLYLWFVSSTIV